MKSLREKLNEMASGEILGETVEERKRKASEAKGKERAKAEMKRVEELKRKGKAARPTKEKEPKVKKVKEPKPPKAPKSPKPPREPKSIPERKVSKESFFKRKEPKEAFEKPIKKEEENYYMENHYEPEIEESINPNEIKDIIKGAEEGYEDVLSILNIKENIKLDVDFKSSDLDYIEFTPTAPLGFDFDEVTDFISRVKYTINRYEAALEQRNKDVIITASEVKRVERRMIEQNHDREVERIVGNSMSEEESLIEENSNLIIEINNLKGLILEYKTNSPEVKRLEEEVRALRAENEMLIHQNVNPQNLPIFDDETNVNSSNKQSSLPASLPTFENDEKGSMLDLNEFPKKRDIKKEGHKVQMPAFKDLPVEIPSYNEDEMLGDIVGKGKDNFDKMMKDL